MNRLLFLFTVALTAPAAVGFAAGPPCVVCGEPTQGNQAVVHGTEAYAIHPYPCQGIWDRAVEAGALDGVTGRIESGSALFDVARTTDLRLLEAGPRFNLIRWALFLLAAMTTSGLLAMLLGSLFGRPRLGAFLLGFFIPAVGMVLVPVLPEARSRTKSASTEEKSE
jgi:hypothetical protein